MDITEISKGRKVLAAVLILYLLAMAASAAYLVAIINFACTLVTAFRVMGNSIAVVMFVYGGVRYVYTADDPGGRKQAMGICIAAVMALIIMAMAANIINGVGAIIQPQMAGITKPSCA